MHIKSFFLFLFFHTAAYLLHCIQFILGSYARTILCSISMDLHIGGIQPRHAFAYYRIMFCKLNSNVPNDNCYNTSPKQTRTVLVICLLSFSISYCTHFISTIVYGVLSVRTAFHTKVNLLLGRNLTFSYAVCGARKFSTHHHCQLHHIGDVQQ